MEAGRGQRGKPAKVIRDDYTVGIFKTPKPGLIPSAPLFYTKECCIIYEELTKMIKK